MKDLENGDHNLEANDSYDQHKICLFIPEGFQDIYTYNILHSVKFSGFFNHSDLCEINIGEPRISKYAILTHLQALNIDLK